MAYLNDQLLATASDSTYTGSLRIGLVAQSAPTTGHADVRFDNYGVYPVSCEDTVPPTVVSTSPSNGATGVSRSLTNLSITFNEPMNPYNWSMNLGGFGAGGMVNIGYHPPSYTFILTRTTPGPLLSNWAYTITINPQGYGTGFVDLSGNSAPTTMFSFTTGD